jgi:hypothetical protein
MTISIVYLRSVILPAVLLLFTFYSRSPAIKITGKVIYEKSGNPVAKILVYITEGDEEDLTNEKGEFSITTSKALPLTITTEQFIGTKKKTSVTNITSVPVILRVAD